MSGPSAAELLALWERGVERHPIDRALLLAGWAAPELPSEALAELPLGLVNRTLLRLRETWFGGAIRDYIDCEGCDQRLELSLDIGRLAPPPVPGVGKLQLFGHCFRLPCSCDLAAVAHASDVEVAALALAERCCVSHP